MANDTPASSTLPRWPQKAVLTNPTPKLMKVAIICRGKKITNNIKGSWGNKNIWVDWLISTLTINNGVKYKLNVCVCHL